MVSIRYKIPVPLTTPFTTPSIRLVIPWFQWQVNSTKRGQWAFPLIKCKLCLGMRLVLPGRTLPSIRIIHLSFYFYIAWRYSYIAGKGTRVIFSTPLIHLSISLSHRLCFTLNPDGLKMFFTPATTDTVYSNVYASLKRSLFTRRTEAKGRARDISFRQFSWHSTFSMLNRAFQLHCVLASKLQSSHSHSINFTMCQDLHYYRNNQSIAKFHRTNESMNY